MIEITLNGPSSISEAELWWVYRNGDSSDSDLACLLLRIPTNDVTGFVVSDADAARRLWPLVQALRAERAAA